MEGMACATVSWISNPQFTGQTPDRAPNMVLAMVRVIRLGFSEFNMGIVNLTILRSLSVWSSLDGGPLSDQPPF